MNKREFLVWLCITLCGVLLALCLFAEIYRAKNPRRDFDSVYIEFLSNYSYHELSTSEKLLRFLPNVCVSQAKKRSGGECWELCSLLQSELYAAGIPSVRCLGLNVPHTWLKVYVEGEWLIIDPTDDLFRFQNGLPWGVNRDDYDEKYKKIYL